MFCITFETPQMYVKITQRQIILSVYSVVTCRHIPFWPTDIFWSAMLRMSISDAISPPILWSSGCQPIQLGLVAPCMSTVLFDVFLHAVKWTNTNSVKFRGCGAKMSKVQTCMCTQTLVYLNVRMLSLCEKRVCRCNKFTWKTCPVRLDFHTDIFKLI